MGELRILGKEGDSKHIWNPDDEDQTKAAKKLFEDLTGKGFKAWRVDKEGDKAGEMKTFDPKAGKVILTPRIVGG